jgi:hypothetical protein
VFTWFNGYTSLNNLFSSEGSVLTCIEFFYIPFIDRFLANSVDGSLYEVLNFPIIPLLALVSWILSILSKLLELLPFDSLAFSIDLFQVCRYFYVSKFSFNDNEFSLFINVAFSTYFIFGICLELFPLMQSEIVPSLVDM